MHAKPEWLPKDYKNWDALLTAAVRKGMRNGNAPADLDHWTYGSWHVDRHRASAGRASAAS